MPVAALPPTSVANRCPPASSSKSKPSNTNRASIASEVMGAGSTSTSPSAESTALAAVSSPAYTAAAGPCNSPAASVPPVTPRESRRASSSESYSGNVSNTSARQESFPSAARSRARIAPAAFPTFFRFTAAVAEAASLAKSCLRLASAVAASRAAAACASCLSRSASAALASASRLRWASRRAAAATRSAASASFTASARSMASKTGAAASRFFSECWMYRFSDVTATPNVDTSTDACSTRCKAEWSCSSMSASVALPLCCRHDASA